MEPYVFLYGETLTAVDLVALGCVRILDLLPSPFLREEAVQRVILLDDLLAPRDSLNRKGSLFLLAKGVRDREEAMEAGSFARFLHALPSALPPSCPELHIQLKLSSKQELDALCGAIGNPTCELVRFITFHPSFRNTGAVEVVPLNAWYKKASGSLTVHLIDACVVESLIPALKCKPCSITNLTLVCKSECLAFEDVPGICKGLENNSIALTVLIISRFKPTSNCTVSKEASEQIGNMLSTNTSLESLTFLECQGLPGHILQKMFTSLAKNSTLTSLSLKGSCGDKWPTARFLLGALRMNGHLLQLNLRETPLESKQAAINAFLERNRRKAEQIESLRKHGGALVPPTTVRLFLCGFPFSGKTTLCRSLVRWNTSTCPFANAFSTRTPKRTRGIEVSTIENYGVKVSLWDMAGQQEDYAFHDQMFPDLSNDATPSLFLFVWNPIQLVKLTGKGIRDEHGKHSHKLLSTFADQFRYWLKFIASKTLKSLNFKPKLFVAITRKDLLPSSIKNLLSKTFSDCQYDFRGLIEFEKGDLFEMNARKPSEVQGLARHIFACARSTLDSKPRVYEACNQARQMLPTLVNSEKLAPVIEKEKFFSVFKNELGLGKTEMQEAVALSLNESGDLIYFRDLDWVVVDTQWFCCHFMGELLHLCSNPHHERRGFFSSEDLQAVLLKSTRVHSKRQAVRNLTRSSLKGETLVKLLIGLQLACVKDDKQAESSIFFPASLCSTPRRPVDPRQYLYLSDDRENIWTFMGRRLKCSDPICTYFTPGIFSFLQVAFKDIFEGVTLHEDVIAFFYGGAKVLIEYCKHEGQGHFIDVLIHSRLDLNKIIEWVYEEVLHKIEKICAKPKGIQGVQLVHEVIRPRSVQEYDCMEKRLDVAVSKEVLRATLRRYLEKQGSPPCCIEDVLYAWQAMNDSDRVIELLGSAEIERIVRDYREQLIKDVEYTLGVSVEQKFFSATSEPVERVFGSSPSAKEREWLHEEVSAARKDIQEIDKRIQEMDKRIQILQEDVRNIHQSILPKVVQRIEDLLTFAKDGEVKKLPRLFVVTGNEKGFVRKLVSAIVPGLHCVRLELLCEHRNMPHLVDKQQAGIGFATLEDGLLRRGLSYVNMFLKLATLAVRVGAHVACGYGHAIPDFSELLALVVDTPELVKSPTISFSQALDASGTSRVNLQEGQQWLFDVLAKHDCCSSTRIHDLFGLSRVRYHDFAGIAWLCDEHRSLGDLCPV